MKYPVVFEDAPDGSVGAFTPDVPGVGVVGESREEALRLLETALQWHVEALLQDGTPIPRPGDIPARDQAVEVSVKRRVS